MRHQPDHAPEAECTVCRLAAIGKALADPIRLRMLELMAQGRSCCSLPDPASRGVPRAAHDEPAGICVCEFQDQLGLAQSKTSYHLRVLREAGLVDEETRGKWSFYSLRREAAEEALAALRDAMGLPR
jgi:ArsR family transcriptional regulator